MTAILHFAATAHEDGVPTCCQWFLKTHDLLYHHGKFQKQSA